MLFIPQIAIQIYTVLDKSMLGWLYPSINEVGYYEQSQKIVKICLTIVTSLGTVMIPRIANIFSNGNHEEIKEKIYQNFKFVFFLSLPISFGIIGISNNFVPWFYGAGFEKVSTLLKIFSILAIIIGLANVIGVQYLIPTKRQNKYTISVICGAISNVILNFLLFKTINILYMVFHAISKLKVLEMIQ